MAATSLGEMIRARHARRTTDRSCPIAGTCSAPFSNATSAAAAWLRDRGGGPLPARAPSGVRVLSALCHGGPSPLVEVRPWPVLVHTARAAYAGARRPAVAARRGRQAGFPWRTAQRAPPQEPSEDCDVGRGRRPNGRRGLVRASRGTCALAKQCARQDRSALGRTGQRTELNIGTPLTLDMHLPDLYRG